MISLCQRAGYIKHGEYQVSEAIKNGNIGLLIIAKDASENSKNKLYASAKKLKIESFEYLNKALLGKIIGKDERSCLAVCNREFAEKILLLYKEGVN